MTPEPKLLADPPPVDDIAIEEGPEMITVAEHQRILAAAVKQASASAWADSRRAFKKREGDLIAQVAKETSALLREMK